MSSTSLVFVSVASNETLKLMRRRGHASVSLAECDARGRGHVVVDIIMILIATDAAAKIYHR